MSGNGGNGTKGLEAHRVYRTSGVRRIGPNRTEVDPSTENASFAIPTRYCSGARTAEMLVLNVNGIGAKGIMSYQGGLSVDAANVIQRNSAIHKGTRVPIAVPPLHE